MANTIDLSGFIDNPVIKTDLANQAKVTGVSDNDTPVGVSDSIVPPTGSNVDLSKFIGTSTAPAFLGGKSSSEAFHQDVAKLSEMEQAGFNILSADKAQIGGIYEEQVRTKDRINYLKEYEAQGYGELAVNTLMQGVVGEMIGGSIQGFGDIPGWVYSQFSDEPEFRTSLSDLGEWITDSTREEFPILQRTPGEAWATDDKGWYFNSVAQAFSTLGLLIPAAGYMKAASSIPKLMKALKVLKTVDQVDDVADAAKVAQVLGKMGNAASETKRLKVLRGMASSDKFENTASFWTSVVAQAGMQRVGENMKEARGVYRMAKDDTMLKLQDIDATSLEALKSSTEFMDILKERSPGAYDMLAKEGQLYLTDNEKESIANTIASRSAQKSMNVNYANFAFDIIQTAALFKIFKPTTRIGHSRAAKLTRAQDAAKTAGKATATGVAKGEVTAFKKGMGMIKDFSKGGSAAVWASLSEGPEEIINHIGTEEGMRLGRTILGENEGEDFMERLSGTYLQDPHAWEAAFHGVMGGMLFQGVGGAAGKAWSRYVNKAEPRYSTKSRLTEINSRGLAVAQAGAASKLVDEGYHPFTKEGEAKVPFEGSDEQIATTKEKYKKNIVNQLATDLGLNAARYGNIDLLLEHVNDPNFITQVTEVGLLSQEEAVTAINDMSETIKNVENLYKEAHKSIFHAKADQNIKEILVGDYISNASNSKIITDRIADIDTHIEEVQNMPVYKLMAEGIPNLQEAIQLAANKRFEANIDKLITDKETKSYHADIYKTVVADYSAKLAERNKVWSTIENLPSDKELSSNPVMNAMVEAYEAKVDAEYQIFANDSKNANNIVNVEKIAKKAKADMIAAVEKDYQKDLQTINATNDLDALAELESEYKQAGNKVKSIKAITTRRKQLEANARKATNAEQATADKAATPTEPKVTKDTVTEPVSTEGLADKITGLTNLINTKVSDIKQGVINATLDVKSREGEVTDEFKAYAKENAIKDNKDILDQIVQPILVKYKDVYHEYFNSNEAFVATLAELAIAADTNINAVLDAAGITLESKNEVFNNVTNVNNSGGTNLDIRNLREGTLDIDAKTGFYHSTSEEMDKDINNILGKDSIKVGESLTIKVDLANLRHTLEIDETKFYDNLPLKVYRKDGSSSNNITSRRYYKEEELPLIAKLEEIMSNKQDYARFKAIVNKLNKSFSLSIFKVDLLGKLDGSTGFFNGGEWNNLNEKFKSIDEYANTTPESFVEHLGKLINFSDINDKSKTPEASLQGWKGVITNDLNYVTNIINKLKDHLSNNGEISTFEHRAIVTAKTNGPLVITSNQHNVADIFDVATAKFGHTPTDGTAATTLVDSKGNSLHQRDSKFKTNLIYLVTDKTPNGQQTAVRLNTRKVNKAEARNIKDALLEIQDTFDSLDTVLPSDIAKEVAIIEKHIQIRKVKFPTTDANGVKTEGENLTPGYSDAALFTNPDKNGIIEMMTISTTDNKAKRIHTLGYNKETKEFTLTTDVGTKQSSKETGGTAFTNFIDLLEGMNINIPLKTIEAEGSVDTYARKAIKNGDLLTNYGKVVDSEGNKVSNFINTTGESSTRPMRITIEDETEDNVNKLKSGITVMESEVVETTAQLDNIATVEVSEETTSEVQTEAQKLMDADLDDDLDDQLVSDTTLDIDIAVPIKTYIKILDKLSANFNINYITYKDAKDTKRGYYNKNSNTVYINLAHLRADTPFHEFAHPLVHYVISTNPELYTTLKAEIDASDIGNKLMTSYANRFESKDGAYREAITTLIGYHAMDNSTLIKSNSLHGAIINIFNEVINSIRAIFVNSSTIYTIPKTATLKDIGRIIAKGQVNFNTGNFTVLNAEANTQTNVEEGNENKLICK